MRKIYESLFLTLSIYGLLGWLYIVLNSAVHPESLSWPLTHFLPYPREDTAGIVSFIVSFLSFFGWNITRNNRNDS
jgi:hypothetical protein